MEENGKIKPIASLTKKVFEDCVFPGGAIVAANSFQPYFPKEAKNYKFVWPRDGAFISHAADILKMNISDNFYNWCMKAEAWEQKGVFFEKYYISGKQAASNFQPDQTGALLWSVGQHIETTGLSVKKFDRLIQKSADGISKLWNKDHFCAVSEDLWEERLCFPDLKENFTYSLASVYKGLMTAYEILGNKKWKEKADEMALVIHENIEKCTYRSFGLMDDDRIDASLLGLIWPFRIEGIEKDSLLKIVSAVEEKLVKNTGVYRYEHDEYDGWMYNKNINRKKGSGYWPLLNFWMVIALLELDEKEKAMEYYYRVLKDLKNDYIPEQIFNNEYQVSVSPLCWSHAMFVIASDKLGLI